MQFWVYGHTYKNENVIAGKYDSYDEAVERMYELNGEEYEYVDMFCMEWGHEPAYLGTVVYNYEKVNQKVYKI